MNPHDIATQGQVQALQDTVDQISELITKHHISKPAAQAETYLRGVEVIKRYKISKSHLHDLKIEGKIPYSSHLGIDLYPQSQIDKLLEFSMENSKNNQK